MHGGQVAVVAGSYDIVCGVLSGLYYAFISAWQHTFGRVSLTVIRV